MELTMEAHAVRTAHHADPARQESGLMRALPLALAISGGMWALGLAAVICIFF